MKRSAQIGLLVMGALGTTTAAGYMLNNQDQACQASAQNNPQATPERDCQRRRLWSYGGHGYGGSRPIFGSRSPSPPSTAPGGHAPGIASRGGFGGHGGGSSGG
jgi:hypothetical protein